MNFDSRVVGAPLSYSFPGELRACGGEPTAQSGAPSPILCMIAGLAIVWVLTSVVFTSNKPHGSYDPMHPMHMPGAFVSASSRFVSARIAGTATASPPGIIAPSKCKTFQVEPSSYGNLVVADCPKSTSDAEAWKSLDDEERSLVDQGTRDFLKSKSEAIVMIFAPWCSHCHANKARFAELSKAFPGTQFLCINAESLLRTSFGSSAGAIFALQYFPTFLHMHKTGPDSSPVFDEVQMDKIPEVLAVAEAATADEATVDEATEPSAAAPSETTAEMLNMLF